MRHALVPLVALAALAAPAAPASASSDADHVGWCNWAFVGEPTHTVTPADGFTAVLDGEFVVASPTGGPVGATVTCTYFFRGDNWADPTDVQVEELVLSGTGVVAGARQVTMRGDMDIFSSGHCETVDYADDTPTYSVCSDRTAEGRPTHFLVEEVDHHLSSNVPGSRDAICAALRALAASGIAGLYVTSDGDFYFGDVRHWDC